MRAGWPKAMVLLAAVLVGGCRSCAHRSEAPAPSASVAPAARPYTRLPETPRQHSPWKPPPTDLPKPLVTATRALFDEGLADPRGLEYRTIRITAASAMCQRSGAVETRGWVLPGRRFAVAWNGLVYPVLSVGARADLGKDVADLISADRAAKKDPLFDSFFSQYSLGDARSEAQSVLLHRVLPLQVVMLLRLGKPELASRVWKQLYPRVKHAPYVDEATDRYAAGRDHPYLLLADDWMWAGFDRAVCAHMRGDDMLALAGAAAVSRARGAVEAEAERRGFRHPRAWHPLRKTGPFVEDIPYLAFLRQLPDLIADARRRLAEPRLPRPTPASLAKLPDASARIMALIRDLENVDAADPESAADDPTVQALVDEGAPAVEPLLHVLETDQRWTRGVEVSRGFEDARTLVPVAEPAYAALSGIIGVSLAAPDSPDNDLSDVDLAGRRRIAARIRALWKKSHGMPKVERWYRVLADDHATPERWLQVANHIVQPPGAEGGPEPPTSALPPTLARWFGGPTHPTKPGEQAGEPLRHKMHPSVVELMSRRVRDLQANAHQACEMALALSTWDGKRALPALQELDARLMRRHDEQSVSCVADLTIERARAGDRTALLQYAAWLRGITPGEADDRVDALTPLWTYPRAPELGPAAKRVFDEKSSPWVPLDGSHQTDHEFEEMLLVRIPAFRAHALRMLSDQRVIGRITVKGGRTVTIQYKGGGALTTGVKSSGPLPKVGTTRMLRMCDEYARLIFYNDKGPPFEVYWDRRKRDSALEATRRFLQDKK